MVSKDHSGALWLGSPRRASARQPWQPCDVRGGADSHGQRLRSARIIQPHLLQALDVRIIQLHLLQALDVRIIQLHLLQALDVRIIQLHLLQALDVRIDQLHLLQALDVRWTFDYKSRETYLSFDYMYFTCIIVMLCILIHVYVKIFTNKLPSNYKNVV